MGHYAGVTILDNNREKSHSNLPIGALTVAYLPTFLTDWGTYKTALDAITLGTLQSEIIVMDSTVLSDVVPSSVWANRELKVRVDYSGDTTGKKFSMTIACPDMDALTKETDSDYIVLADGGVMAAFVTAFEAIVRSPDDDSETCTVLRAQLVGRNI